MLLSQKNVTWATDPARNDEWCWSCSFLFFIKAYLGDIIIFALAYEYCIICQETNLIWAAILQRGGFVGEGGTSLVV